MSKWDEDYFWYCDTCGLFAQRLEVTQLEEEWSSYRCLTHKECGGHVHVLLPEPEKSLFFPTITELSLMPEEERRNALQTIRNYVNKEVAEWTKFYNENAASRKQSANIPRCPTCGSTNIKHLSNMNRAASFFTWGFASDKLGKQFECLNCKYKW